MSPTTRTQRISGSSSGARKSVLFIGIIPAIAFVHFLPQAQIVCIAGLLIIAAAAARSVFIGIYVDPDNLIIVSWFRTWKFDRAEVGRVVWRRYSGLYNRYIDDDRPTTPFWMIGFGVASYTRLRKFPAILGSRKKIERVAMATADAIGVRSVRVSESFT